MAKGSVVRFVRFDMASGAPTKELLYNTDRIQRAPVPATGFAENGITEILSMDDSGERFLVLERSFSAGSSPPDRGFDVRLYLATTTKHTVDVIGREAVTGVVQSAALNKKLLFDVGKLGIVPDNLEGLQVVRTGCDETTVIVVSYDNFFEFGPQSTQFVFLKIRNV